MSHLKEISVLILCGGKGTRLGTIGEKNPKTLMTINKKPIISYIIDNLINNGCKSINISGYHNYKKLNSYIRKLNSKNIRCRNDGDISILERVKKYLIENKKTLLVCYGDEIANIKYSKLLNSHFKSKKILSVTTMKYKSNFGIFTKNSKKLIFNEKPYLGNCNIGFMLFDYANIRHIKNNKKLSNYFIKMCKLNLINEYIHNGKHITVNTLEDLANAKTLIKKYEF